MRLKEGYEAEDEDLKTWIKAEGRLRPEILQLTKRNRSLAKENKALRASTTKDLNKLREDFRIANARLEEWRRKYTVAMEEKVDIIHRFAVCEQSPLFMAGNLTSFPLGYSLL
jgi:hypothetical protein